MEEKKQRWLDRLMGCFGLEAAHHRTCRLCHQRILRAHKYRHVRVGIFGVDRVEHKNCANPEFVTPDQRAQRLTPELPFDAPGMTGEPINREPFHPLSQVTAQFIQECDDLHQEKIQ